MIMGIMIIPMINSQSSCAPHLDLRPYVPPALTTTRPPQAYMSKLGYKPSDGPGFLTPKPPFWERPTFVLFTAAAPNPTAEEARFAEADKVYTGLKRKYDISRNTVTRTGATMMMMIMMMGFDTRVV